MPVGQLPLVSVPVLLPGSTLPGSSEIWVENDASGTISIIASPPQIGYFAASPNPVDVGGTTTLLLGLQGGAGPSTITYAGLPSSCPSSDTASLACAPSASGS